MKLVKTRISLSNKAVIRIGFLYLFTSLCILCSNMIDIWILDDDLLTNDSFPDILYTTFNLMGFFGLILGLFALFIIHHKDLGKLGYACYILAALGTMLYAGDAWFEAFVIPFLSDEMPGLKDIDPGISLMVGIVITFLTFSIGWITVGVSAFRVGLIPKWISSLIIIGGIFGFRALTPPYFVPLAIAVGAMGVWFLRSKSFTNNLAEISNDTGEVSMVDI
ncbi:hypothetical protein ACFPVX_15710 [Cohnella faecalis]|uniref:DUF4386 family protein n=1 Tax=Cohnella faecalis TaxID=2315694 RepID=A0A398CQ73_9BACL|nr:hypothetical protein [Cohnella faecalis]RIE01581.1 hypothetical protein D3H35_24865 [Cohnella faecalis]